MNENCVTDRLDKSHGKCQPKRFDFAYKCRQDNETLKTIFMVHPATLLINTDKSKHFCKIKLSRAMKRATETNRYLKFKFGMSMLTMVIFIKCFATSEYY